MKGGVGSSGESGGRVARKFLTAVPTADDDDDGSGGGGGGDGDGGVWSSLERMLTRSSASVTTRAPFFLAASLEREAEHCI